MTDVCELNGKTDKQKLENLKLGRDTHASFPIWLQIDLNQLCVKQIFDIISDPSCLSPTVTHL